MNGPAGLELEMTDVMMHKVSSSRGDDVATAPDLREWGTAAHIAVWSASIPNRLATIAAGYCAWSLLPWLLLLGSGRRVETSLWLVGFLLPLPLLGAVVSGLAYRKAAPPAFAGRGVAATTLFVHGIHLAFLVLTLIWSGVTEPGNRLACAGRLRQIGQSLTFYAMKYDAKYPPTLDLLILHADTPAALFVCDATGDERASGATLEDVMKSFHADPRHNSYVYAAGEFSADEVTRDHVLVYEHVPNHAGKGMNVLFGDGNARWVESAEANRLVSDLAAGHNPPRVEAPSTR